MLKEREKTDGYNIYRNIAEWLIQFKLIYILNPNGITIFSMFLLVFISVFILNNLYTILIVVLFQIFIISDYLDGSLAREKKQVTVLGDYLEFFHHYLLRIVIFVIPVFLYPQFWLYATIGLFFSLAIPNLRDVYQSKGGIIKGVNKRGSLTYVMFNEFFLINTFCIGVLFKQIYLYYLLFDIYATFFITAQFYVYLNENKKLQ